MSVARTPFLFYRVARRQDRAEIHLDRLQHVRAGRFRKHHVLGGALAQTVEWNEMRADAIRRGRRTRYGHGRSLLSRQVLDHIAAAHSTVTAGAGDLVDLHLVPTGKMAHTRR